MTENQERPRVYLEEDCPVAELSVEAQRERGASSALPPLYFLHVWWARRPLTTSRAAVLGSLLPAGYPKEDFLALMGVPRGANPLKGRQILDEIRAGIRPNYPGNKYGYKRGFSNIVPTKDLEQMREALTELWGSSTPTVLDSFAGGGSIPFEAYRMGFNVILNELNPVACVIERATIEYPAHFGPELTEDIQKWGDKIASEVKEKLKECFPRPQGELPGAYIWVRTVSCPSCELEAPLSPNWWLDKKGHIGYQLIIPRHKEGNQCRFKIKLADSDFDPDVGSIIRGVGTCPRCAAVLESDYIKGEAQAGRMGHQLAVVESNRMVGKKKSRTYREVTAQDLEGVIHAEELLAERFSAWDARGLVPNEDYPEIANDPRPHLYGMEKWYKFFNPRQLLVHLTTLETILDQPWQKVTDDKRREALRVYLAFVLDKGTDRNSIQTRLIPQRLVIANTFDRHDFAIKWSYGEIDGSGHLWLWGLKQVVASYAGIIKLLNIGEEGYSFLQYPGDAGNLNQIESSSIEVVSIDPPYYNNVMYAECSDFFYVWMKRSLGGIFPNLFDTELTNKDDEAVANVARFKTVGRGKGRGLAEADYEAKMAAAFRECHRVLKPAGVLTIMFTHKKVEAWDTLAMALMENGFEITASWPIHTEFSNSLHQAKKNAAASTILLVCRKRAEELSSIGHAWWEDLQYNLDERVRERASHFAKQGLKGQDISIACFGPALNVVSQQWPVKTRDGETIKPEVALDRARSVVSEWFIELITEGKGKAVDNQTRFYVLAWYIFRARVFPYDEGRKLGISVGINIDDLIHHGVVLKKGNNIALSKPGDRARKGKLRPDAKTYPWDLDYVQAAIHAYDVGQSVELNRFHQRTAALQRDGYRNAIGYLLDVLPRTDEVTEYHLLDAIWESNLHDKVSRRRDRKVAPTLEQQKRLSFFETTDQEDVLT